MKNKLFLVLTFGLICANQSTKAIIAPAIVSLVGNAASVAMLKPVFNPGLSTAQAALRWTAGGLGIFLMPAVTKWVAESTGSDEMASGGVDVLCAPALAYGCGSERPVTLAIIASLVKLLGLGVWHTRIVGA